MFKTTTLASAAAGRARTAMRATGGSASGGALCGCESGGLAAAGADNAVGAGVTPVSAVPPNSSMICASVRVAAILVVAWFALMIWLLIVPLIRWGTTHFAITDRRLIFRSGIITKTGIDIPIARINSVQFRHDLVDRMFRTGTLVIESASDEPLEFADIPQVEKVHALLYDRLNDVLTDDDGNARL